MKKHNLLTFLILVTAVLTSTVKAFAYTEVGQTIVLSAQPAVSVQKISANESGTIEAYHGTHEGMNSSFLLKTNGTDENYDFIVGSDLVIGEGTYPGLSKNGNLIFANMTLPPSSDAINDAIQEGSENPNVIVYPFTVEVDAPMTVSLGDHATKGRCYMIKVNNQNQGTITQTVGGSPVAGTYLLGVDQMGSYKATVYITVVSK